MPDLPEEAMKAASDAIFRSPRKAVYEMADDLANAALKAAAPAIRHQRDEELRERLEQRARNAEGQASLSRKQNPHAAIRLDAKAAAFRDFADSIFEEDDDA